MIFLYICLPFYFYFFSQFLINILHPFVQEHEPSLRTQNLANMFGGAERKYSQHLRFEEFVPSSGWTDDSDSYCLIIDLPGFKREQVKLQIDNYGHIVASGERQVNEYKHIRFEQSFKVPENSDIEDTTAKFEDEILYIVIPKKIKAEKEPQHEITNIPEAVQEEKETGLNAVNKVPEAVLEEEIKGKDRYTDAAAEARQEKERDGNNRSNEGKDAAENCRRENERDSNKHSNEKTNDEEKDKHNDDEEGTEESHDAKIEKQRYERSLVEKLGKELKKNKGILITAVLAFSLGVLVSRRFQTNEK